MGRVIGRKHFYCRASFTSANWLIFESRCKSKGIEGGLVYCACSRHYAYKIARVLNDLYRLNRLGVLARWKFVSSSSPCTPEYANNDWRFALDLLSPDDFRFLSASIVGGQDA